MWDSREQVEKEFPRDQWEHIPVKDEDEGRAIISSIVMSTGKMMFGQARWFDASDGVILIKKDEIPANCTFGTLKVLAGDNGSQPKRWWSRWKFW